MKSQDVLRELEEALVKNGVKVSYETLAETTTGGGLCKVRGQQRLIIEKRSTPAEKMALFAKTFVELQLPLTGLSPVVCDQIKLYSR